MDDTESQLPHLPHLSTTPNLISSQGLVYAMETAYLGNCLSAFANLIGFSVRTGTPVVYPNLMDHAGLFDFADRPYPYAYNHHAAFALDAAGLAAMKNFAAAALGAGYFETYMQNLRTIPPEWLSHLGPMTGATVFLGYDMQFRDWAIYEETVARCASRGNAVVLPGAYWWQYREMPVAAAEAVRKALPIGHQDRQQRRVERMVDPASGIRIGMHVRRGDYENYRGGEYFWELSTYLSTMHAISRTLNDLPHLFVLCSNGHWTEEQLEGLPCTYEQGSSFDDFVALSQCDVIVGPPSTYANWAAFLGRKKRLILTPSSLISMDRLGLSQANELAFPTSSGVPGDFWAIP